MLIISITDGFRLAWEKVQQVGSLLFVVVKIFANYGIDAVGMDDAPVTIDESVAGLTKTV
jgi:hypothetical protein